MTVPVDLLVVLYDAGRRWSTMRATVHLWQDRDTLFRSTRQMSRSDEAGGHRPWRAGSNAEACYRIEAATRPTRLRLRRESLSGEPGMETYPMLVVDDGSGLWEQLDAAEVRRRSGHHAQGPVVAIVQQHLLPRALLGSHDLEVNGEENLDGRDVWRVTATPQDGPASSLSSFPRNALGRLTIDKTTGIVLGAEWSRGGLLARTVRLDGLVVDDAIEPDAFSYTPPLGAHVSDAFGVRIPTRYVPGLVVGAAIEAAGEMDRPRPRPRSLGAGGRDSRRTPPADTWLTNA